MNNQVTIFNSEEFGSVRTVTIDGEPWFVGKDVADALGYTNSRKALSDHVDDEDKNTVTFRDGTPGNPNQVVINESGLYSLVILSKLESAKRFKHWITSEVLPSLRKNGGYIIGQEKMSDAEIMAQALITANRIIQDRDARIKSLEVERDNQDNKILELNGQIDEMKPASEFANQISHSDTDILVGDFAKLIQKNGLKIGRNKLFDWFVDNGYLDQHHLPYQRYMKYFSVSEYVVHMPHGDVLSHTTRITGRGQVYFTKKILDSLRMGAQI